MLPLRRVTAFVVIPVLLFGFLALQSGAEAEPEQRIPTFDAVGVALGPAHDAVMVDLFLRSYDAKLKAEEAARVAAQQVAAQAAARKAQEARLRAQRAPVVHAASAAPPVAVSGDYSPPEGCMVRMAPKEKKSVAEAHRCWDGLLARYSWNQATAFQKLYCESGGNPYAVGPATRYGTAQGLMQILPGGSFDPLTNMNQAWAKYRARGWQPWQC